MSFILAKKNGWIIDTRQKGASLIPNTLNLKHILRAFSDVEGGCLVDAGAGAMPYEPVYRDHFDQVIAFDHPGSPHPNPNLTFHAEAHDIPLEEEQADAVLCSEVLEHVPNPGQVLQEFRRILKPGGMLVMTTPFFEGIHEAPHDYFRYTAYGIRHLCEAAGLEVDRIEERGELIGWSIHMAAQLQSKFWKAVSRLLRLPVNNGWNPLVFLGVRLPQYLYLYTLPRWERRKPGGLLHRLLTWSRHYPLGYMTLARKPGTP